MIDVAARLREQAAGLLALAAEIDGAAPTPKLSRRDVILAALELYSGSLSGRCKELSKRYSAYLAGGWRFDRNHVEFSGSAAHRHLYRLAKANDGRALCWRRIFDIAGDG
ncbi:MAG: hypothetical protein WBE80_09365 [Methylocella sp.]